MSTETERPLRRDAERNRQRIMAAARTVFAERGLDVSMDDIAHAAGVGVGTVYRRFPDKDQLIDALFEEQMAGMLQLVERCLAIDDPWEGFVTFLGETCGRQSADRGLKELLLSTGRGERETDRARDALVPLVIELVDRAKASGALRADIEATDVPLLQVALGAVMDYTVDVDPEVWRRVAGVLVDGLRGDRAETRPLPGPALELDEVMRAMRAWRPGRR